MENSNWCLQFSEYNNDRVFLESVTLQLAGSAPFSSESRADYRPDDSAAVLDIGVCIVYPEVYI